MRGDLISIIVPIYGVYKYLNKCISSICAVNYKNIEVILVDDGSIDDSGSICDEWVLRDNRVQVIHKENGGLVSARKAGLNVAKGKYVTYVDGDDWVEPEIYDDISENDADLFINGYLEDNTKNIIEKYNHIQPGIYEGSKLDALKKNAFFNFINNDFIIYPSVWSKVFNRELLIKYQNRVSNEISMGEDVTVSFPCILNSNRVIVTETCKYHYNLNPNGMTAGRDQKYIYKCIPLFSYIFDNMLFMYNKKFQCQVMNYMCYMLCNGISIAYDFRYKNKNINRKNPFANLEPLFKYKSLIENSELYKNDNIRRGMVNSLFEKKYSKLLFTTFAYRVRNHI